MTRVKIEPLFTETMIDGTLYIIERRFKEPPAETVDGKIKRLILSNLNSLETLSLDEATNSDSNI